MNENETRKKQKQTLTNQSEFIKSSVHFFMKSNEIGQERKRHLWLFWLSSFGAILCRFRI